MKKLKHEIVFVGRSNVGKSTLIRALIGKNRKNIKIGKRPGVTLKPNYVYFKDLVLTDMPGFGFMSGVPEVKQNLIKDFIVQYIEKNAHQILLAIQVIDANSFIEIVDRWNSRFEIPIDLELFEFLLDLDIEVIVAANKMDKVKNPDNTLDNIVARLGMLPPWRQWINNIAPISAKKGEIKNLKNLIKQRLHNLKRDDLLKCFN
ncbi:MAG: GTP-binding protein EngB [Methanosarcinales archaeon]